MRTAGQRYYSRAALLAVGILSCFPFATEAAAQSSVTQTRSASIGVAVGLSLYVDRELNFGSAVASSGPRSVAITDAAAGKVTISGQSNKTVYVTLTPPPWLLGVSDSVSYAPGAGYNATADDPATATIWTTPSGLQSGFRLKANRTNQTAQAFVYVFGSVNVGNVPPGVYSGTYLVSVSY